MAIVLDMINDVKTDFDDFTNALDESKGIRCCLDVDMVCINQNIPTTIRNIRLIPLEHFSCKRTICGVCGTDIVVESEFGLDMNDFITFDFKSVDLIDNDKYAGAGLLISSDNIYYEIVEQLSEHFKFISHDDAGNSFILDESELSKIQLVPFKLDYHDGDFYIKDIETEMATSEFDKIMDSFACDCAL